MRIQTRIVALIAFCAFSALQTGALRCESTRDLNNIQSRANYADKKDLEKSDSEFLNDKSQRYQVLEWVIKQSLQARYQKLTEEEVINLLE